MKGTTFSLVFAFAVVFALALGLLISARAYRQAGRPALRWPAWPPFAMAALAGIGFGFYLASGYVRIEAAMGGQTAQIAFVLGSVVLPAVAGLVCLAYWLRQGLRPLWFLLGMGSAAIAAVGLLAFGISRM